MASQSTVKPSRKVTQKCLKQAPCWLQSLLLLITITLPSLTLSQTLPFPQAADWGSSVFGLAGAGAAAASNQDAFNTNPGGLVYLKGKNSAGASWQSLPRDHSRYTGHLADGTGAI